MEPQANPEGQGATQEQLIKKAAIVISPKIKRFKHQEVEEILDSEFPINTPVTDTQMSSISLTCSLPDNTQQHHANILRMLETIWKFNPDINHQDRFLRTPLHFAARTGNNTAVDFLLSMGVTGDP